MAVTDTISSYLPTWSANFIFYLVLAFIAIIIICSIGGFIVWWILMNKRYNKTIKVFEKIGKNIIPVYEEKAMYLKLNDFGDYVLHTRKSNKYIPISSIQMSDREFWFYVREDGEWINFGLKDLDEEMRKSGALFLSKEMRYARSALQKNFRDRLIKITFMQKYGGLIMYSILILVTGVMVYLMFDKYLEIAGSVNEAIKSAKEVVASANQLLVSINNLQGTGGFKSASIWLPIF